VSSSPVLTPPVESLGLTRPSLLELFEQVGDPRARRGVRHRFAGLLAVALAAVLAGARSFTAIGEWVADAEAGVLVKLGIAAGRRPCEATIRRAFARLDADRLDAVLGAWMRARVGVAGGRRVIAIDGKTVRGARAAGNLALRTLLEAFDLVNAVITADAMHTQTGTATYIRSRGGHYVLTVKSNQPGLFRRCKSLPWAQIRSTSTLDTGHGRRVRRTIKVAAAPQLLDFPHAVQVAQIRGTRTTRQGKKSVEVVYIITSMPPADASPTQIATWVQGHWGTREQAPLRSVTSSSTKTAPPSGPATRPASWPRCARPRSASCAWPGSPISPAPPDITPATPTDPSNYC